MSDDFRQIVEDLAEKRSPTIFYNSGTDRSVISLSNIFKTAKNNVCIFAQSLCDLSNKIVDSNCVNPATKEDYINALKEFIEKPGAKLQILLQEKIDDKYVKSEFLKTALAKMLDEQIGKKKEVEIRTTKAVEKIILKSGDQPEERPINFTFADGKMYRLEFDIKHRVAECCFNTEAEKIKGLERIFKQHWQAGTSILSAKQRLPLGKQNNKN